MGSELGVLGQICIGIGFMINTNCRPVFLVEFGNVACWVPDSRAEVLATGILFYQYSFL